jgi:WD40 repeat protein
MCRRVRAYVSGSHIWQQSVYRLVTGSDDCSVHVWSPFTARTLNTVDGLRVLTGHTSTVQCVVIDDRRQRIVSGSADRTVRVWKYPHDDGNNDGDCMCIVLAAHPYAPRPLLSTMHTHLVVCQHYVADETTSSSYMAGGLNYDVYVWDMRAAALVYEPIADQTRER